jgi:hypothetical protein
MEKKATKKKVTVKLVNQTPAPVGEVYVLSNEWNDRHGDRDSNTKVYSTKEKADEAMRSDIKEYLIELDAVKAKTDGSKLLIDHKAVAELNGESLTKDRSLDAVLKTAVKDGYIEINVDSSGTNAYWSVSREEVL